MHGGVVADGGFVVAGGQGSVAFQLVDAALDGTALPVDVGVEARRPAALGANLAAIRSLVGLDRDGRGDAPPGRVLPPVAPGAVRHVGQDPVRPGPGPAAARAGNRQGVGPLVMGLGAGALGPAPAIALAGAAVVLIWAPPGRP